MTTIGGDPPLPLAVGVLGVTEAAAENERREARLDLALLAYKLGYFLVDIIEVRPAPDDTGYRTTLHLAELAAADAFIVHGAVDLTRLESAADRQRMVIRKG